VDSITVLRIGPRDVDLARRAVRDVHERANVDDAELAPFLADSRNHLHVAVHAGEVVGSLNGYALHHPGRREPQFLLYEIDVRTTWRRRGIATRLVESFMGAARDAGAFETWVLTNASNDAAMALYRRCGFVQRNADDVMLSVDL
jgi:ribosomal protein S18 acetylase RimI-like enzyme